MSLILAINGINLFAGSDWIFTESIDRYPASLFDLQPLIKTGTEASIDLTAYVTKDGDDFKFNVPNAQTVAYTSGEYYVQYVFTQLSDSAVFLIATTQPLNVRPLLSAAGEHRTSWEINRDLINDSIKQLVSEAVMSAEYMGRKYTLSNIKELRSRLAFVEQKIAEERGEKFQDDEKFLVRFVRV